MTETPLGLQNDIDKLYDYCTTWKLKLNTGKSQIVIFRKGNRPVRYNWHFGDHPLHVTDKIPYLGLLFTSNGLFRQAQVTLSEQANKAVYMLYRRISSFSNLKPDFMLDLFDKLIVPILNYGCEVWGHHDAPNIEQVHLKFCKNILGVRKSTQNDFVYGELGRFPMHVSRKLRIIKYWLNIVTGQKSYYINVLYADSLQHIEKSNKPSWTRSVKLLLCSSGFGEVWFITKVSVTQNYF